MTRMHLLGERGGVTTGGGGGTATVEMPLVWHVPSPVKVIFAVLTKEADDVVSVNGNWLFAAEEKRRGFRLPLPNLHDDCRICTGAFGIGFCSKGMMADRIAIPIPNAKGEVVAYAGRFPGKPGEDMPQYKLPPGFRKSQELFNLDRAAKEPADQPLIIVEGFFDAMKLHQHGCRKVVALTTPATLDSP